MQTKNIPTETFRRFKWSVHCLYIVFKVLLLLWLMFTSSSIIFAAGKNNLPSNNGPSTSNALQSHQILCCAFNADGTVFVTGSSDTFARVCLQIS